MCALEMLFFCPIYTITSRKNSGSRCSEFTEVCSYPQEGQLEQLLNGTIDCSLDGSLDVAATTAGTARSADVHIGCRHLAKIAGTMIRLFFPNSMKDDSSSVSLISFGKGLHQSSILRSRKNPFSSGGRNPNQDGWLSLLSGPRLRPFRRLMELNLPCHQKRFKQSSWGSGDGLLSGKHPSPVGTCEARVCGWVYSSSLRLQSVILVKLC